MKQSKKAYGFNSMIVRLKVFSHILVIYYSTGFNSMIVRLKVAFNSPCRIAYHMFQFYDSPIKRTTTRRGCSGQYVSIL